MDDTTNAPQPDQILASAYQYNYTHIEPIALVDTLPQAETFAEPWLELMAVYAYKLVSNTLIAQQGDQGKEGAKDDVRRFLLQTLLQTLREEGPSLKLKLVPAIVAALPQIFFEGLSSHEAETEVPQRIEAALQQSLYDVPSSQASSQANSPIALETSIQPPPQGILPDAAEVMKISQGIETALQQSLYSVPSNEAEAREFVRSNPIRVLGKDFLKAFLSNLFKQLKQQAPTGRASGLEDYLKLFATLPLPKIADSFQTDEFFALMRVAGPNPVMIERLTTADRRFPVTEAQYKSVMGDSDSLQAAIEQGRVYLADYAILEGALNGTFGANPPVQKYAYAPLAMFAVPESDALDRLLRPVAIQCGQTPTDYPVITPATGADAWLMAKTIVQIADMNFHEPVSHLARTHLLIEPFVIATHRQLPPTHPLFKLLLPHFQGTLAINNAAHEYLVAAKGSVHRLLSSPIENSRVLAVKGLQARGFNADMLPRRLQDRGVDDPAVLPVYPYRDDGLLVWGAIHDWVEAYLSLYYNSDDDVRNDRALQNWAKELVAFDGGRLQDFGNVGDGAIETIDYLIDAVTMVIFTGSAQHAAVNFAQNELMSFAPAMPAAGYVAAEAIGAEATPKDWLNLLPPLDQAQQQLNLLYLLGSVHFTRLGHYEDSYFTDSHVAAPLQAFQDRLQAIEATIDRRNVDRPAYIYLKPSQIPQSINI